MTARQYRAALAKIGYSQLRVAKLLGIAGRTSQGYALGETAIPTPAAIVLRLLMDGKITVADVEAARDR